MSEADARWCERLAELHAHVGAHGRLPPRGDATGLGAWVDNQRQGKKAAEAGRPLGKRMTQQRVAALEAVPGWEWASHEAAWEEKLAAVRAFVVAHGRLPSSSHPSRLGEWTRNQRRAKRASEAGLKGHHVITPQRAAALEAVPGWTWEVGRETAWEEKLAAVRAYVAEHARLPPARNPSGLGAWVSTQRQAKKAGPKCKNKMTPERVAALEAVPGWTWDDRRRAAAPAAPAAKRAK
jgi:hypothetical protein